MTLTDEQIAEIRARVEAATPGPWGVVMKGSIPTDELRCAVAAIRGNLEYLLATIENGEPGGICDTEFANALFISHARDDIPALLSALEAANKRADEAEARRKCYECGSEMTACARCNPELPTAELTALRARVAELEGALTYARDEYDQMIWGEDYEYRKAGERVQEIIDAALKGTS